MARRTDTWERLESWRRDPGSSAILTDIDGTLAPIAPTPDLAEVPEELRERYLLLAGISGRGTAAALDLVSLENIVYFGNHGFEILRGGELEEILRVGVSSQEGPPEIVSQADLAVEGVQGVEELLEALLVEE